MDIGSAIRATLLIYLDCAKEATKHFKNSWPILIGSVVLYYVFLITATFFSGFGMTGGFIIGAIQLAMLMYFYTWIRAAVNGDKVGFKELLECDFALFFDILSVAFILFIFRYAVGLLIQGMDVDYILILIQFVIVFVFNSVPEVIYLGRVESVEALKESALFTRDNLLEWYIPLLILVAPILFITPIGVLGVVATSEELLPIMVVVQCWDSLGQYYGRILEFFGLILGIWYMLFRGSLYQALTGSTRRQRIYQSKQR